MQREAKIKITPKQILLSRYYASKGKRMPLLAFQKLICSTFGLTYKQIHSGIVASSLPLSYEKHPGSSFSRY